MRTPKNSPKAASEKATFHAGPRAGTRCDLDTHILRIDDTNLKSICLILTIDQKNQCVKASPRDLVPFASCSHSLLGAPLAAHSIVPVPWSVRMMWVRDSQRTNVVASTHQPDPKLARSANGQFSQFPTGGCSLWGAGVLPSSWVQGRSCAGS